MGALAKIERAGFHVALDGDGFEISPSSKLTMPQREFLRQHRAEIIEELKTVNMVNVVNIVSKTMPPENKKGGVYCFRTAENPKAVLVMVDPESELQGAWESLRRKYGDRLIEVFVMPNTQH